MNENELLAKALQYQTAAERVAYLDAACAGDAELRARIEALLQSHVSNAAAFEPTADSANAGAEFAAGTADYQPPSGPGAVIAGRYKLIEQIGVGGMGEVWAAKQDEPVKRMVAVKLIKAGMDSKAVLSRFDQERQALAMMDHPNIAKVFDAGLTEDRRPYFVMELVSGEPLTKYCDDNQLGVRERLELFVPLCHAVQHAHQKGIVHRDLKPTNILVANYDGRPVPKVIDFGVAKATGGRLTDDSLSTQFGAVVGTLEYMAPEQAGQRTHDVDTRADIYALGVVLYELLTGLRPFDSKRLKQAAMDEVVRILRVEEPPKPSTRLSVDESAPTFAALRKSEPKRLSVLLRGELDWVVMKCLEKDRNRRYETANGLARDVQRYLADEPVEARPPTAGYRFKKFLHRNKGPVLAVTLLILALLAGIAGTTWGLIEARKQEQLALAEAAEKEKQRQLAQDEAIEKEKQRQLAKDEALLKEKQRQIAESRLRQSIEMASLFATDALKYCDDALVPLASRQELLLVLVNHLEKQVEQGSDEATVDAARIKAWLYQHVARIYGDMYQTTKAKEAVDKGMQAMEQWLKLSPPEELPHARSHQAGLLYNLANYYQMNGKSKEAKETFQQVLHIRRELLGQPMVDRFTPGKSITELADSLDQQLEFDEAIKYRQQAYDLTKSILHLDNLCGSYWKAAEKATRYDQKKAYLIKADELSAQLHKLRPTSRPVLKRWAKILIDWGMMELRRDEVDKRRAYTKLAEVSRKLVTSPDLVEPLQAYGRSYYYLGSLEAADGNLDEARKQYSISLDVREQLLRDYPNDGLEFHMKIDKCFSLTALGRHKEAFDLAKEVHKWAFIDPNVLFRVICIYNACISAVETARHPNPLTPEDRQLEADYREKALVSIDELMRLHARRKLTNENHGQIDPNVFPKMRGDPRCEALVEQIKAANGIPREPEMAGFVTTLKTNPNDIRALIGFARLLEKDKQWQGACVAYRKIVALDPKDAVNHFNLGVALFESKDSKPAIASLRKSLELEPDYAAALYYLGLALRAEGNLKQAQELLRRAHLIGSRQTIWMLPSAEQVKQIDRLVELEQRLLAVLRGEEKLEAPAALFQVCSLTKRHAAAVEVYSQAFRAQPALAEDLKKVQHRYNAVCAALLAADGQSEDAKNLDIERKMQLRGQALQWLQADLAVYIEWSKGESPEDRQLVQKRLRTWKKDADLVSVRDKERLLMIPEDEAAEWNKLWTQVDVLIGIFPTPARPAPVVDSPAPKGATKLVMITKVEGNKVTYCQPRFNRETQKLDKGDETTITIDDRVRVGTLKFDPQTKKAGFEPLEGKLKNEKFARINENDAPGLMATFVYGEDKTTLVEIRVTSFNPPKKKE